MKRTRLALVVIFGLMIVSVNGLASSITDWTIGAGGTVSFDGTETIAGAGLPVTAVQGVGTLTNNGVALTIYDGSLTFSDSNYTGGGTAWTWGASPPGTLSITGCLVSLNCGTASNPTQTLLSDDFQSLTVTALNGTSFQLEFGQVEGNISDTVASEFGVSTAFAASSFNLTLFDSSDPAPGSSFSSSNYGGTLNATDPTPAAENWNLSTSLMFFVLIGAILGLLTRARVLRVVLPT